MDNKLAKKIGEMMAFSLLSMEIHDDIGEVISKEINPEDLQRFADRNEKIFASLEEMMEENNASEIAEEKAIATARKIKEMRNLYLKGEENDITEVLEWLGFFVGGALAHFNMVKGLSSKTGEGNLEEIANTASEVYLNQLGIISEAIENNGKR